MENNKNLEKRMYFLVPYNISPIQQAIQAGHSMGEYALKYGRYNDDHLIWEFLGKWKTWMVLNGGTTNSSFEFITGKSIGGLNQSVQDILDFNNNNIELPVIEYSTFEEPDLNDALTAICLIVDERVFNREDYPDFKEWFLQQEDCNIAAWNVVNMREDFYYLYKQKFGEDIAFLKELLNTKKLA